MDQKTPRDQFLFANARVARRWRKLLDERLNDLGVTQARWSTMVCLQRSGGLTQRELTHLMAVENPTLVRLLDSLEEQGLIERRPNMRDRRTKLLYLTNAGERFMSTLNERASVLRHEMLKDIENTDLEVALRVLERVMENSANLKNI
ncbi:MarR family transcriptional regulator [Marinobacter salarius]|jgi:MarR family transcriptional regulator for hemolysin|uniref:Transcriptional regulator n=2 Tax=Marinobacter TaxID=2742 RepID=A6EWP5_9GAMM|nr:MULTISPECIES: MarR family transcriptional regulator [Marinobacter]ARM84519.1 transcriptional regulator SlyA [Marinobacter salarius]EDM49432.1 Transcriptional regulator [Marinobacter algicola DG893]MCC4285339.1 MarR family transcriptional regulator [Marinobacter salarius]VVS97353.1 Transcriptional regulator SlyA [Marinobacter salarius]VXC45723.1 Transcriptional regulator SlyA [Marinobacter salarius]|tara:strand:- start:5443 stop:5886 length:444 start_codon:yes stop_codon:yes gene_type:complete